MVRINKKVAFLCISILMVFIFPLSSLAEDELSLVPSSSWAFVRVKSIDNLAERLNSYAAMVGSAPIDLRDRFIRDIGAGDTIDTSKPIVFVVLDPQVYADTPIAVILNVKNYEDFALALEAKASEFAGIMEGIGKEGPCYFTRKGDFVILSSNYSVVNAFLADEGTIEDLLSSDARKVLDESDIYLYVNVAGIVPAIKPYLMMISAVGMMGQLNQMQQPNGQQGQMGMDAQQLETMQQLGAIINAYITLLDDLKDFDAGIICGEGSIRLKSRLRFKEGSNLAEIAGMQSLTDEPLLVGMPQDRFAVVGGSRWNAERLSEFQDALIQAIVAPLQAKNPELANKYIDAARKMGTIVEASSFRIAKGSDAALLIQSVLITKNADEYLNNLAISYRVQAEVARLMGQEKVSYTYKDNAGSIDGLPYSELIIDVAADAGDTTDGGNMPMPIDAGMFNKLFIKLLGSENIDVKFVRVDDKLVAVQIGKDEGKLRELIESAKERESSLNETEAVKRVAALLPKERIAEFYLDIAYIGSIIKDISSIAEQLESGDIDDGDGEEAEESSNDALDLDGEDAVKKDGELVGAIVRTDSSSIYLEAIVPAEVIKAIKRFKEEIAD